LECEDCGFVGLDMFVDCGRRLAFVCVKRVFVRLVYVREMGWIIGVNEAYVVSRGGFSQMYRVCSYVPTGNEAAWADSARFFGYDSRVMSEQVVQAFLDRRLTMRGAAN
jgi:hypothetical protein